MKKIKNISILFFLMVLFNVNAQQTIVTSGGEASGVGGKVSYSIGQVVYNTYSSADFSITQGVQQPYEISVVLETEKINDINIQLSVFPNPTSYLINLKVENYDFDMLAYRLYDINGKLYTFKTITQLETKIEMGNFPSAIYFLKILKNNKEIKVFKIIKK